MPKRRDRNKKSGSQIPGRMRTGGSQPRSVSELLARAGGATLRQIKLQPFDWATLVRERLPAELAAHVAAADFADGELTLFTESAVWSARLRYAMADAEDALRSVKPEIRRIGIRVAPASRGAAKARRP